MKFSICIPNYNYARYLGRTITSVLEQRDADLEILIADNASTDDSVAVASSFRDPRIKVAVNRCNVGFARNLDKAAAMATGDYIIMLSSDDLMRPGALASYRKLLEFLGPERAQSAVLTASADIIDSDDKVTGQMNLDPLLWKPEDERRDLPLPAGGKLYAVDGDEMLRRCLRITHTPFNFLATATPQNVYQRIEGYGGARVISPDKWYHWRVLAAGGLTAYYVDAPLFAYRWHASNQAAQQSASGALKQMVDDYANIYEFDASVLERLGMTRSEFERAFVEWGVARRGLSTLARVGRKQAFRIWLFGLAAYPQHARRNPKMWTLAGMLGLGPLAEPVARALYKRHLERS